MNVATQLKYQELQEIAAASRERAIQDKTARMPLPHRVEHLRKRLRQAQEETGKRMQQCEITETEIDKLQSRLRVEQEAVEESSS